MTMRLTFGAQIPGNQTDFSLMRDVAQTMDATRWHSAWTYDHFVPPLDFMDETGDSLEGWMSLAALGEATSTLDAGHAGVGGDLSQSQPGRQDDGDARSQHGRPRHPRTGRRRPCPRARLLWLGLPLDQGTLGSARGSD